MKSPKRRTAAETVRVNEKKWGKALMEAGWTAVPSILLEHQQQLGLDAVNLNVLLQIAKHWWYPDQAPFPSKKTLAARVGVSPRTVQRRLSAMVGAKLIHRVARTRAGGGNDTTEFYFDGLIKRATPYAVEKLKSSRSARRRTPNAAGAVDCAS